jgi:hypothetical protein
VSASIESAGSLAGSLAGWGVGLFSAVRCVTTGSGILDPKMIAEASVTVADGADFEGKEGAADDGPAAAVKPVEEKSAEAAELRVRAGLRRIRGGGGRNADAPLAQDAIKAQRFRASDAAAAAASVDPAERAESAKKIQALFRGYSVRKKQRSMASSASPRAAPCRARSPAPACAVSSMTSLISLGGTDEVDASPHACTHARL